MAKKASIFDRFTSMTRDKRSNTASTAQHHQSTIPPTHHEATAPKSSLLKLPAELLIQIFNQISFVDLLAFRLTSRQANSLISHGDLPRERMTVHHRHQTLREEDLQLYMQLYPPPQPFTFTYLLQFHRRTNSALLFEKALHWFIADFIMMNPDLWPSSGSDRFQPFPITYLPPEYALVRKNMVPLLLTIQHYLEHLRHEYLKSGECAPSKRKNKQKTTRINAPLNPDRIFESSAAYHNPNHLLNTHHMFMILCWVMKRLFDPASHHHRATRLFVSYATHTSLLSDSHVRMYVLLANLQGLSALLRHDSYKQRRKTIFKFLASLDPHASDSWEEAWVKCSLEYNNPSSSLPTKAQATRLLSSSIGWHDIWIHSARTIFLRHRFLQSRQLRVVARGTQRLTLLCSTDISGYHGVQGRRLVGESLGRGDGESR